MLENFKGDSRLRQQVADRNSLGLLQKSISDNSRRKRQVYETNVKVFTVFLVVRKYETLRSVTDCRTGNGQIKELLTVAVWSRKDVEAALCRRGWFGDQPVEFRRLVLNASSWREFGHNETVFSENDSDHALHAVVSGLVKYSNVTETGEEYLAKIFKPGDWLNYIALLDGATLSAIARVSGSACMLRLSQAAFESLVNENPRLHRNFSRILCVNLRDTAQRVLDLNALGPEQRLAKLLLEIEAVEQALDPVGKAELEITQTDLCQLVFLSRASVNRILGSWHNAGWVDRRYGKVVILNHQPLRELACKHASSASAG